MSDFTEALHMPLADGGHSPEEGRACVMEKVAILWAVNNNVPVDLAWTDMPICTNPLIAKLAQCVNDHVGEEKRQQLNVVIPRLLRARQTTQDKKINEAMVLWALDKSIAWYCEPRRTNELGRKKLLEARAALDECLGDLSSYEARDNFHDAIFAVGDFTLRESMTNLVDAVVAEWRTDIGSMTVCGEDGSRVTYEVRDHHFETDVLAYALLTMLQSRDSDAVAILDEALDVWEEQIVKADEPLYISQEWEDEALKFINEYMSEPV